MKTYLLTIITDEPNGETKDTEILLDTNTEAEAEKGLEAILDYLNNVLIPAKATIREISESEADELNEKIKDKVEQKLEERERTQGV